jgi:hypothetical protein
VKSTVVDGGTVIVPSPRPRCRGCCNRVGLGGIDVDGLGAP